MVNYQAETVTSASLLGGSGANNIFYRRTITKIVPASTGNLYVAVGSANGGVTGNEGIWKSTNGGISWTNTTKQAGLPDNVMYSDLVIDPSNPRVLYAAVGEPLGSAANGVYMTSNGGLSWSELLNLPHGITVGRTTLAMSPDIGSATSPQFELYASLGTNAETQVASITTVSEDTANPITYTPPNRSGNYTEYRVTVTTSGANMTYPLQGGDLVQISGVNNSAGTMGAIYDGDQVVDTVTSPNTFTYLVGGPGQPATPVATNAMVTTEPSSLYQAGIRDGCREQFRPRRLVERPVGFQPTATLFAIAEDERREVCLSLLCQRPERPGQ